MRTTYSILIACSMILMLPAVAADDPTYQVPDPTVPADAAQAFADATKAGATDLSSTVSENATGAANDIQTGTFPGQRAENVAGAAGAFGTAAVGNADVLADTAAGWTLDNADEKRGEGFATVDAAISVAVSAVDAGSAVVGAAAEAVCSKPLLNDLLGEQCGESSIVNATRDAVDDFADETQEEASQDRTVALFDAIRDFVNNLFTPPQ